MLIALGCFAGACTLTHDDFEPERAQLLAVDLGDDGGVDAGGAQDSIPPPLCLGPGVCCEGDDDCRATESCNGGVCGPSACEGAEDVSVCELALCPGPSCPDPPGPAARCDDGAQNGSEGGVDCGQSCPLGCGVGADCSDASGCVSENCLQGRCAPPSCDDGSTNQDESDTDCGGSCDTPCQGGDSCNGDGDCADGLFCPPATRICTDNSCQDGARSGREILTDCGGGECPGCPAGTTCSADADCSSGSCEGARCVSCSDGATNGTETDTDCGGSDPACDRCEQGDRCVVDGDCIPPSCEAGICAGASCDDDLRNGTETGVDCGGSDPGCPRCPDGSGCNQASDCGNDNCVSSVCISCGDSVVNGTETDFDCGGNDPACRRCAPGRQCQIDSDCESGACQGGRCCGGNLGDCTRCAERLSPTLDCGTPGGGVDATGIANCGSFLQCLTNNPATCPTRNAVGCSGDNQATDACPHNDFGGNAGTGVTRANQVLQDASCQL